MKQYVVGIMKSEKKGFVACILRFFLLLLSGIYYLAVELRSLLYKIKIFKSYKLSCPVICVGNITVGGTGKTPIVITLTKMLSLESKKIVVLSRGYKRKIKKGTSFLKSQDIRIVSDGDKILLSAEEAGDEPYLLAENLINTGIIVGADRFKTGQTAIDELGAEIIILDDGFQHRQLHRDLDIVVIDCLDPFGQGYLLPRGFLREPLRNLSRADVFLLTRINQISSDELMSIRNKLIKINSKVLIVESMQQFYRLERLNSKSQIKQEDLSLLQNKEVISVCGIGNPVSFEKTLETLGAKIVGKFRFSDHFRYNKAELKSIFKQAEKALVVTTEKDGVKIKNEIDEIGDIFILRISSQITKGYKKLKELIISKWRK